MIFRRIGRFVRRAVDVGKGVFNTVKKTVSDIVKNPLGAVKKVLDKVPFPKVIKGFVDKFMNSPLAALLPGPIAGIAAMLANANTAGDIFDIVKGVVDSKGFAEGTPAGKNNVLEMAAAQHAKVAFPQIFS